MTLRHAVMHLIDKKPDGSPAVLHKADAELALTDAAENLVNDFNHAYNGKQGKAWGFFHGESGAYPFSGWLTKYMDGEMSFLDFTGEAVEHLQRLLEESAFSSGGHVLFAQYQCGMTEYLNIAVLQHADSVLVDGDLQVRTSRQLDLGQMSLAARINLTEWRNNTASKLYVSYIKGKNGKKISDIFRDFIGCMEGVDGPGETRTMLKAFSDFVEKEDLPEEAAREKTLTLIDYATTQAKIGGLVTLDELSAVIDEDRPGAFAAFARAAVGVSPETPFPVEKSVINQFRRFTGRAEGLSISFEAHLLGEKVEFDPAAGTLLIKGLPTPLVDQLKRNASKG
ncbi:MULTISPECIES: nucleoid-associated protein YejK [Pseudomonas]|uniref:nucleoid-associated protein YejK n=1 Tax=Pseudomonas TaxID=286 RepID=UPI0007617904|nr:MULTISPECIES: nucleoid-associated protein YejK [Pseudomonas]MDG9809476.1 nucleoid-associated protein YejK [Pseudomonas juntendi]MDG9815833.1 nucleoid-associated protein YejK [Pseudomonas putida]